MSDQKQTLSGPDFGKGIDISSVSNGEKIVGHVGGSQVLLVRTQDTFYAIGPKCTHYGADLVDGMLVNNQLHCPWHHACFDIKTGDALKAPALTALATWKTEVEGTKVFVREQHADHARQLTINAGEHFVIIGSGAAGHAASERLRHLGFDGQLTILSSDSDLPYDRPNLSKDYLAGSAPEEWIPLRSAEFYAQQKISIQLNCRVDRIDTQAKHVILETGETIKYTKCLIATGGAPARPPIGGLELEHVHFLRSFADCRSLIRGLNAAGKILIIGSGFIGLEAAAAIRARKLDVTIVSPDKFPLERVVGSEVGIFLKAQHEKNGVAFHLGRFVKTIEKDHVVLDDGSTLGADLVLAATGIRPESKIAKSSRIDFDNGILVDQYLQTSAADVFAAGDIARWPSIFSSDPIRVEHWVVAQRQGQTAAANMLGLKKKYSDIPFFWSQQFDVIINYTGHAQHFTSTELHGSLEDRNCSVAYIDNNTIKAVLTVGRDMQNLEAEQAFEQDDQKALRALLKG